MAEADRRKLQPLFITLGSIMNLGLFSRWQRWALCVGLGVALLWLLSGLAVPRLVHWQIEKQGTQRLGRTVQVESVAFRPWSMALLVRGLRIAQAGADQPAAQAQLTVGEIEVNAALSSLFWLAPVADAIVVRHPQLKLTHRGQGRFDIDDVLQRFSGSGSDSAGFPRMSLFNIQVEGGGVTFRDEPQSVTHTLSDLRLDVPFLSNIGGRREVTTHPRLAFQLNGAAFDTDAETAPFAADRRTQARFQVKALDAAPYLPYWPAAWPVRLADGQLEMDITLDFQQQATPQLSLSGHVALRRLKLHEQAGREARPWLQWEALDMQIAAWRPLASVLQIDALRLDKPVLHLRRDRAGVLNTSRLQRFFAPANSAGQAPAQTTARDAEAFGAQALGAQGRGADAGVVDARYVLQRLDVSGGQLNWQDATTQVPVSFSVDDVTAQIQHLAWPSAQMASLQGQARLQGAKLSWDGQTDLNSAQVNLQWRDLPLQAAAPYLAQWFQPQLSGQSAADLSLDWRAATGSAPQRLVVKAPQIRVRDVSWGVADKPVAALAEGVLEQVEVEVLQQQARVGRVALTRPLLHLSRNAQGRWMFQDWPVDAPPSPALAAVAAPAAVSAPATPPAAPQPWQLDMGPLDMRGGEVHLDDRAAAQAVKLDARDVNLTMGAWQPLAASPSTTPFKLDLNTGPQRREPGRLVLEGTFRAPALGGVQAKAAPPQLKGRLQLTRFPVHKLSPYLAQQLNFDLKRADLSYAGSLDLDWPDAGMGLHLQGHLSLEKLRALDPSDAETLLDIQALNVRGLDLALKAGALRRLKIAETALSDFFARIAIDEAGHLNLAHLVKTTPATATATPSAVAAPQIDLGPIGVVNGRVAFSDRYIRPHYSADVTELAGSLGALSNQALDGGAAPMAELKLRGRVAGSASLEVQGTVQPLTRPVALDVRGQVRDLELPQLSPYSSKYAGYGIERGKLSAEVNYRIGADGQLQASHQIVLNQLRFGDRSDSEDAPNLPVKLAVALLADRNGVIDLQLPVSGSINDPDFRVGAIVWKMVLNLIGKAILSPFSLLTGALSGEEQLEQMAFAAGQADVDAATRQKLQTVAQLLIDKPALRLTLVGQADLAAEREAWRSAQLRDMVLAEKRRRLSRDGQSASAVTEVGREEYPALLQAVYRRSPVPKPRNVLGLVKDLPPADMEALLLAAITVDESDMRALAQARAQQVREVLLALNVPAEQLFLGAEVVTGGPRVPSASSTSPTSAFVPQVALTISTD